MTPTPLPRALRCAAAALLGTLGACPGREPTAPASACTLEPSVALDADPSAVPLSLSSVSGELRALLLRASELQLLRVRAGAPETLLRRAVPSAAGVTPLREGAEGPTFAYAGAGNAVTLATLLADSVRESAVPRGEPPLGRESLAPALALGVGGTEPALLGAWDGLYGAHFFAPSSVTESVGLTPARRDRFAHPDVAMAGEFALVAQERRVGTFEAEVDQPAEIELAALPNSLYGRGEALVTRVSLPGTPSWSPRVAPFDPSATPASPALLAWLDAQGVSVALASPRPLGQPWSATAPQRLTGIEGGAPSRIELLPLRGSCGVLAAVLRGAALELYRVGPEGTPTPRALRQELGAGSWSHALARAGSRVVLAASDGARTQGWDLTLSAECSPSLAPLAEASVSGRLVGLASGEDRLLLATAVEEGEQARVSVLALPETGSATTVVTDAMLPRGVRSLAQATAGTPILGSATPEGAQLDLLDDEDPESILVYLSQGTDLVLAVEPRESRLWAVEVQEFDARQGFAQSVVTHSLRDDFGDGPQTEVRTGFRPPARFGRFSLAPVESPASAHATLWSAAQSEPGPCLPGIYLRAVERGLLAPEVRLEGAASAGPWPGARALLAPEEQRCEDRVYGEAWSRDGAFALGVAGPAVGLRVLWGSVATAAVQRAALEPAGARATAPGLARDALGTLVAWSREGRVRVRWFDPQGQPRGDALDAGEATLAPEDARWALAREGLAVTSLGGGRYAVAWPSATGPRARVLRCGG